MAAVVPPVSAPRRRLWKKTKDPSARVPLCTVRRGVVADDLLRQAKLAIERFKFSELDLENLRQECSTAKWHVACCDMSGKQHKALDDRVEELLVGVVLLQFTDNTNVMAFA